jgi:hypothetical protein
MPSTLLQEVGMLKSVAIAAVLVSAGLLAAPDAQAQRRGDWVQLGCKDVNLFGRERDSISVGRREGRFRAIRLSARGNDVEMVDLRVIYANGDPDDIPVRQWLRQGSQTRPLDLRGRERSIRRIDMVYRTKLNFRGRATVCAEGLD